MICFKDLELGLKILVVLNTLISGFIILFLMWLSFNY